MSDALTADHSEEVTNARLAMLGTLVAGIAHELNTPLGAIHSNHDVIERALLKLQDILEDEVVTPDELEEVRRVVRAMDSVLRTNGIAVTRMVKLVESLRNFGRPDRSDVDRVDIHEGLEGTLALLGHVLKNVEIVRDYGELPNVECYPNRVNQVFMNLLHNATQAMPDGGTLTVKTRAGERFVSIEIRDTGRGIDPDVQRMIFQPGFTTKGGRVGMGLGLAISQQIIDHHGGEISVQSEPGQGAAFLLRLPVRLPKNLEGEGGPHASP